MVNNRHILSSRSALLAATILLSSLFISSAALALNKTANYGFENAAEPGVNWTAVQGCSATCATENIFARSTTLPQVGTYSFNGKWTGNATNSQVNRSLTQSFTPSSAVKARMKAGYKVGTFTGDSHALRVRLMDGAAAVLTAVNATVAVVWTTSAYTADATLTAAKTYTIAYSQVAQLDTAEIVDANVDEIYLMVSPLDFAITAPVDTTNASLSWTASTSPNGPALRATNSYRVYRAAAVIATITATSYLDNTTAGNTSYVYDVTDFDANNYESPKSTITFLTRPGIPGTPTFSGTTATQTSISWTAPAGGAANYKVERGPTSTGPWTEVGTGVTSPWVNTNLNCNTTYWYRIRGSNATGDGAPSASASVTTLSSCLRIQNGTDPSSVTVEPLAVTQQLDAFTVQTGAGTVSVTAVTVTMSADAGAINTVRIMSDNCLTTTYGSLSSPVAGANAISLTTNISATTTETQYKVCVIPKTHATLAAGVYAVSGIITSATSTFEETYSDTASATVTVDNQAPSNVTGVSGQPADSQVTVSWTNPGADFNEVVILRKAAASITDVPAEGTTYAVGNTIGSSTVRYVGSASSFVDSGAGGPVNGTGYYYKIFARDSYKNYASGVQTGPHTPAATVTVGDGTSPADKSVAASVTNRAVDAFTLQSSSGTYTVSQIVVTGANVTSNVAASGAKIWRDVNGDNEYDGGDTQVGSNVSFVGNTATFSGLSVSATTTSTKYIVTYSIAASPINGQNLTGYVSDITTTAPLKALNDNTDAILTIDLTPPGVAGTDPQNNAAGVAVNSVVTINWNENIDCATVTTSTVTINSGGWTGPTCSGKQARFTTSSQANNTTYTVTVGTGVKDVAANAMASSYVFKYTTAAAAASDTIAPNQVFTLTAQTSFTRGLRLRWTAPYDDGTTSTGTVSSYDVRFVDALDYPTNLDTTSEFDSGTIVTWAGANTKQGAKEPIPATGGTLQYYNLGCARDTNNNNVCSAAEGEKNLWPNTLYYVALKSADDAGNASTTSNVTSPVSATGSTHTALKYGWNQVSIPYITTGDTDTFNTVFGDELGAVYMYRLDAGGAWTKINGTAQVSTMTNGRGLYLYSSYNVVIDHYDSASTARLAEATDAWTSISLPNLGNSNNLVGTPYLKNVNFSAVQVCRNSTFSTATGCSGAGTFYLFKDAVTQGWVSETITYFANNTTFTNMTCNTTTCTAVMRPWWGLRVTVIPNDGAIYILAVPKP